MKGGGGYLIVSERLGRMASTTVGERMDLKSELSMRNLASFFKSESRFSSI